MGTATLEREEQRISARFAVPLLHLYLVALSVMACAAVAFASVRHTSSLAFPIDDGYIYSNYVLQAAQGHPFTYNPGETSGGITGVGWYLLCTLAYWLLAPFHSLLGPLAPPTVRTDAALAAQAGHLYLAAYLPGIICLALTALGTYRLARVVFPASDASGYSRQVFSVLAGVAVALDAALVWGALSGLEVPLSCALAVWAVVLLLEDTGRGKLRWSLLLVALLPFARPDLVLVGIACVAWLAIRALIVERSTSSSRGVGACVLAIAAGFALLCTVYNIGWGEPLPSSFYAKVGGLRFGTRFFSAAEELLLAGQWLPFVAGALALLGGIVLSRPMSKHGEYRRELSPALLPLLALVLYIVGILFTLPWFGQEQRYLLPVHPFALVLIVGLAFSLLQRLGSRLSSEERDRWGLAIVAIGSVSLLLFTYTWATQNYAVEVRNIEDAHVKPALWVANHTTPDTVLASEPIGAVKLFSNRRTVDLVGLTSPITLGTYRNWPLAWPALRSAGATYLLFYPRWFDNGKAPAGAIEMRRFEIPDNRIAGDNLISVYRLDWAPFSP